LAFEAGPVSALLPLDASGARFNLEVVGVTGVVSSELVGEYRLFVGRVLDAGEADALSAAVQQLAVFDRAVVLLSHRARSARDLRVRLRRMGASDADAAAALQRLQALGLQDDAAYARHLAETRRSAKGASKRRLQQELRRKGLSADVAADAVTAVVGEEAMDEMGAALEAARRRVRSLRSLDPATARRRLHAWLARRGYEADVVRRAVRLALEEPGGD
jgi:regulatory protein